MAKSEKSVPVKTNDDHVDNYNKVVDCADISSVQLIHIEFNVLPRYYSNQKDQAIGYEVNTEDSYYNAGDGFAACLVSFKVEAKDDEGSNLECSARYTVSYRIAQPCDEKAVKTYLKRVGVFACYPYFRGLFANLDWSANTRLPPLPVHKENIKTRPKKKTSKKNESPKNVIEAE